MDPSSDNLLRARSASLASLLKMAVCSAIATGIVEGVGLLVFQRLNWANWGRMLHVSLQILWISPAVDLAFFILVTLIVAGLLKVFPRLPAVPTIVAFLSFLMIYDWLTLTARLYHRSCIILAIGVAVAFARWVAKHEAAALNFWKRAFPWSVLAGALTLGGIQGTLAWQEFHALSRLPTPRPDSPNVLVIVVDTLRADHLSSYGYSRPTSPNIDRLAEQGVLFQNAVSTCSWSYPSHVSLVTGLYQFQHGVEDVQPMHVLSPSPPSFNRSLTLGEALEQRGYRTAAFSANRTYFTRDLGFGRGFIHFEDYFDSPADMFVRTLYGKEFARIYLNRTDHSKPKRLLRFLGWDSLLDKDDEGSVQAGGAQGVHKRAPVVNQELFHWIDQSAPERPFFAFLNYYDVHHPYGGPHNFPAGPWPQQSPVDQYDNGVRYVDDAIGQLMAEMARRGLDRKTIIVFTSDHGESLGQHSIGYHGESLYWEQIHVPLIFWYPGHVPSGIRLQDLISNAAIPSTVMNLLDGHAPQKFPQTELNALWQEPHAHPGMPPVLSEVAEIPATAKEDIASEEVVPTSMQGPMKSLITPQWQFIVHKKFGDQLYDWVRDPGEVNDLVRTADGSREASALDSQMRDVLANSPIGAKPEAVSVEKGSLSVADHNASHSPRPVNDRFALKAAPGARFTVEVTAQRLHPPSRLDSVLAVEEGSGQRLKTCRNPGDDQTPPPGSRDSTPAAFDDACANDDIDPGVNTDSRLEILVPAESRSPVELYLRVFDWDGRAGPGMNYQLSVSESAPSENKVVGR